MATPPFSISETVPADTGIVSQYPLAERTFRDIVESWLILDHSATTGRHDRVTLEDQAGDDAGTAGNVTIWNNAGVLAFRNGTGTVIPLPFASGTRMMFDQSTAPVGWTLDATVNDRVFRAVSSGGGANGGSSWTISGVSVNSHTLTIAEMPAHTHTVDDIRTGTQSVTTGGANAANSTITSPETQSTGGGGGHTHGLTADGTWRPLTRDVRIAAKD